MTLGKPFGLAESQFPHPLNRQNALRSSCEDRWNNTLGTSTTGRRRGAETPQVLVEMILPFLLLLLTTTYDLPSVAVLSGPAAGTQRCPPPSFFLPALCQFLTHP